MAETNTAGQILGLVTVFDRPELFQASTETLLKQVLPSIADHLPDQQAVRVYRINEVDPNLLSLWHGVGKAPVTETIDLNQTPSFAVAIRQPKAVVDDEKHWLIPLYCEDEKLGVLEIRRKSPSPPEVPDWIQVVGRQLSMVLAKNSQRDMSQRQAQVTAALNECPQISDMAGVVAQYTLQPGQFIAVGLIQYDHTNALTGLKVVATANRQEAFATNEVYATSKEQLSALGLKLDRRDSFLVNNVEVLAASGTAFGVWLSQYKIQAFCAFPIHLQNQLVGFLAVNSVSGKLAIPDTWKRLYRVLADQLGARLLNQQAVEQMHLMQNQSRILTEVGQTAAMATRSSHVAETILQALPEMIDMVSLSLFDRPILGDEIPSTITTRSIVLRDRAEDLKIKDIVEAETWDLQSALGQLEDGEFLSIPDIGTHSAILAGNMLAYMGQELGIKSVEILSLRIGPRMLGLMTVGAKNGLQLDSVNLRYLRTLADQISLVVQGQQSLQSANKTVDQFQHIIAFSQAAEATFDRASIFDLMLTESAQMFPADFISITLYNTAQKQLLSVAQRMNDQNQVNLDSEWVIAQTNTTSGRVWEQWDVLSVPDLAKEANLYHPLRDDLRAVMGAPIHSRGGALGLVEIGSFMPHAYSDADVTMFQQMVRQLATTIENAEVYIQGQNLAKNKALAGEIAAELQQQVDLDSILNVTINQLGQTLGARRGRIRLSTDFDMNN